MKITLILLTLSIIMIPLLAVALSKSEEPQIDGIYKMDVWIGATLYTDLLQLKTQKGSASGAPLSGTVTLPTIFTAPLTGDYHYDAKAKNGKITFEINTAERGKALKVRYEGTLSQFKKSKRFTFSGTASDLNEGKVFGKIEALPLETVRE